MFSKRFRLLPFVSAVLLAAAIVFMLNRCEPDNGQPEPQGHYIGPSLEARSAVVPSDQLLTVGVEVALN
jgi:hypothetical protein